MKNYTIGRSSGRGPILKRIDTRDVPLSPIADREYCGSSFDLFQWSDGSSFVLMLNSTPVIDGTAEDINEFFESTALILDDD